MKRFLLVAILLFAVTAWAEEPKVSTTLPLKNSVKEIKEEVKPYCISCRIEELIKEANKLQNLIQQATLRIEQIKGAITELQKAEPKAEEIKK